MLIDHFSYAFIEETSVTGMILRGIGRLCMPIMCFFIAEGFYYTKNVKKYMLRLLLFTVISQIPFAFLKSGKLFPSFADYYHELSSLNVMFTLFLGLLSLCICYSKMHKIFKFFGVLCCCVLSLYSDWLFFGVFYILVFSLCRGNFTKQAIFFTVVTLMVAWLSYTPESPNLNSLASLLALPLLYFYNGKKGSNSIYSKWLFYAFYPAHLLVLAVIKYLV